MDNWNWILLVGGITIGAVVVYLIFNQPVTMTSPRTYNNIEEWEIIKESETGRVKGVRVHRRAEEA